MNGDDMNQNGKAKNGENEESMEVPDRSNYQVRTACYYAVLPAQYNAVTKSITHPQLKAVAQENCSCTSIHKTAE